MTYHDFNYAILGHHEFEVFPYQFFHKNLVEGALEGIGTKIGKHFEFWVLKEPIPFDEVRSHPWLLDPSTNLTDYATRPFRAEKLLDILPTRDNRCLHVVLRN